MFEKHKEYVCIPVYPDNEQALGKIMAINYLKSKQNINISFNYKYQPISK